MVLAELTERLLIDAGLSPDDARAGLVALMRGTLENVAVEGPRALTGPIARGDVETVRAHLAVLPADVAVVFPEPALLVASVEGPCRPPGGRAHREDLSAPGGGCGRLV